VPIDVPKTVPPQQRPMTAPLVKPADSNSATGALQLIVRYDDGHWSGYPIDKPVVKVGRRPDNDIILPDQCVSGYHAEFRRLPDGDFELIDCDSYNGTGVNGGKIKSRKIAPGDFVVFGILQTIVENGKNPVSLPDAKAAGAAPAAVKPVSDGEREKLNRELEALRLSVEKMNGEKVAAQSSLEKVKAELDKTTADVKARQEESDAKKTALDAITAQSTKAQQDLQTAKTQLTAAQTELTGIQSKKTETTQQLDAAQKQLAEIQAAIANASKEQERIKAVQKELAQKEQELTFFVNRLNVAKSERDQTLAESREYRDILTNFETRRMRLEESIAELEAKAAAKKAQVANADVILAKTQAEAEEAKRTLAVDRTQDEQLRKELNMSKDEIQKIQDQIGVAKTERDELRQETKDIGFKSGRFFMPVMDEAKQPSNAG